MDTHTQQPESTNPESSTFMDLNSLTLGGRVCVLADTKLGSLTARTRPGLFQQPPSARRPLLSIENSVLQSAKSTGSAYQKRIPFTAFCFHELPVSSQGTLAPGNEQTSSLASSDSTSRFHLHLVTCDQRGHLYAFNLTENRYWLVYRIGISATSVTFSGWRRRSEILIALSDCSLHCYDIDSNQMVAKLPGYHTVPAHHLSAHPSKALLLSSSGRESILWNTEKWLRKRILTGASSVGVYQAVFTPKGDQIVTVFHDGSVLFWDLETFGLQWKVSLGDSVQASPSLYPPATTTDRPQPPYKHLAITSDQQYMVVAFADFQKTDQSTTSSASVYVWNVQEKNLLHEITIPSFEKAGGIASIHFVGKTTILAVLSSEAGHVAFLEVVQPKLVTRLASPLPAKMIEFAADGSLMAVQLASTPSTLCLWTSRFMIEQALKAEKRQQQPGEIEEAENDAEPQPEKPRAKSPDKTKAHVRFEEKKIPKDELIVESETVRPSKPTEPIPVNLQELVSKTDGTVLNRRKLKDFLTHFGEFPEKYRTFIWRFLLELPENRMAFQALSSKDVHPSVQNFRRRFPMKSDRLSRSMEKVLSCLNYWAPIFESLDYLPSMVFPFIKIFQTDTLSAFEVFVTVTMNWCQNWWDFYPNPPVPVLDVIEDLLAYHDKPLFDHFNRCKITTQLYAWPILQTFFSEVFSREDWLVIWDHLFINEPDFMYFLLIAYLRFFRTPLMGVQKLEDFQFFFSRMNPVQIQRLINSAYEIRKNTPKTLAPVLQAFEPLPRGHYPIYNKYPEFVVNYQRKLREKIRSDEQEYLRKKKVTDEIARLSDELRKDQAMWENIEWNRNEMMEKWWNLILSEEEEYARRKTSMDTSDKERRLQALRGIANARREFLDQQNVSTAAHEHMMGQALSQARHQLDKDNQNLTLDERMTNLEQSWMSKRDHLVKMRQARDRVELRKVDEFIERKFPPSSSIAAQNGDDT